jgi:hypothetical protein
LTATARRSTVSQAFGLGQGDVLDIEQEAPMTHRFVIGRDHPVLFRHMRAHFADVSTVSVTLDRRRADRRRRTAKVANERRRGERRATPASSWTSLGFVLSR